MKKRGSWKTTTGGILTAIGFGLNQQADSLPQWAGWAAQFLGILGPLFLGLAARDNNVTSEEAGAGK